MSTNEHSISLIFHCVIYISGKDCFVDVDHKEISWEIRRLALTMAKYLEDRMFESQSRSGKSQKSLYQIDAVLTQIVSSLAKLHRATMRNWHEMLHIIGNFAYTQETSLDEILEKGETRGKFPPFQDLFHAHCAQM